MSQKFLIGINTKDTPGKLKLTTVTFDTEYVDAKDSRFLTERFHLLDDSHPFVQMFLELFKAK